MKKSFWSVSSILLSVFLTKMLPLIDERAEYCDCDKITVASPPTRFSKFLRLADEKSTKLSFGAYNERVSTPLPPSYVEFMYKNGSLY